jgi:YD repeat-containing protein
MLRLFIFAVFFFLSYDTFAQVNVSTINDFGLKGKVQKCIQQSEYGTETYEFDQKGRLLRLSSRLNQNQKEEIRFIYKNDTLDQKWIEVYLDNQLKKDMSFVFHFNYKENTVEEWTIRLDEESVTKATYQYDDKSRLLYRLLSDGLEEQRYDYQYIEAADSSVTGIYKNNERFERILNMKDKSGNTVKSIHEEWSQGILLRKNSFEKNEKGQITKEELIDFGIQNDTISNTLNKKTTYSYDGNGNISDVVIRNDRISKRQNFIYQYDNHTPSNWVKKIELPSNKYINRIITYYTEQ